ncbi:hypothetical protein [Amycolatopsis plumensis]
MKPPESHAHGPVARGRLRRSASLRWETNNGTPRSWASQDG